MSPPDFPAGPYVAEANPTPARRGRADRRDRAAAGASSVRSSAACQRPQVDRRYKNWTVRQIVHHLADSHMNAFVRFRLTLTEERPTIKPYDETRWAELPDTKTADVSLSVKLLEALHARWVLLLRSMTDADFERSYFHPEYKREFRLAEVLGLYAHHCRHHAGQIAWLAQQRPD